MARFAWVLNLDAELELAAANHRGYNPSARLTAQLGEYGRGSRELLGPDDVLVQPGVDALGLVGRAWCPTPNAVARLIAAGAKPEPHPDLAVLRRVNHRRFAFDLASGLPEQRYVEHRVDLERSFERVERPWLLKRPLAFAGRGQMRVYRPLDATQWKWVDASLRMDGLVLEPLVTPLSEYSLHGFVPRERSRPIEFGHPCVQEVTERGVFRSVRRAGAGDIEPDERCALVGCGERVAGALRDAGYFGPFGIDAYRYRRGDDVAFCALSEINARYTMGFVTGFSRHPSAIVV